MSKIFDICYFSPYSQLSINILSYFLYKRIHTSATPTVQRFPMRTTKQREFLHAALKRGLLYNGDKIRGERKRLKIASKILRRRQRAIERECLQQLLYLSVRNEESNAQIGGGGGGPRGGGGSPNRGFKFAR